jgi:hypothetical protein
VSRIGARLRKPTFAGEHLESSHRPSQKGLAWTEASVQRVEIPGFCGRLGHGNLRGVAPQRIVDGQ